MMTRLSESKLRTNFFIYKTNSLLCRRSRNSSWLQTYRYIHRSTFSFLQDHYKTLGLSHTASQQDIRNSFLELSKRFHPDTNMKDPTLHTQYVQINEAYSILSNPVSRNNYDLSVGLHVDRNPYNQSSSTHQTYYYNQYNSNYNGRNSRSRRNNKIFQKLFDMRFRKYTISLKAILLLSIFLHEMNKRKLNDEGR